MWDIVSKILNIILGFLTLYLYFENRKLKTFEAEKKLAMKKAELTKLMNGYYQNFGTATPFSGTGSDLLKEEREFNYKKNCLEVEIEYLEKLKKYKWLFSKIK